MKRLLLFLSFVSLFTPLFAQFGYWYKSEFIDLSVKKDSVYYLSFKDKMKDYRREISTKTECLKVIAQFGNNEFLIKQTGNLDIKDCYVSTKYEVKRTGGEMVILPQLIISTDNTALLSFIPENHNSIITIKKLFRDIYELDCNLLTSDDVLKLAMEISKIDGVKWCEPNIMLDVVPCNTYYTYQFYLNNPNGKDINAEQAWSITTGSSNVTVAVIDLGVDRGHEDLSSNIINGYTVDYPTGLGSPLNPYESHGTACAGIIGAENNSIGIRGVASGVKILPINIGTGELDPDGHPIYVNNIKKANAIIWAVDNGADVLSCSWHSSSSSSLIESAIDYARTEGRDMKGTVVVFSAGNNYPYSVNFPASLDGVIAVGAVDRNGAICSYSSQGSSLNLVAPSSYDIINGGVYTTANTGKGELGNYTAEFGGTSAACPQVAGVAALMLSVNSLLTESQVRNKIQQTAEDLGTTGFDSVFGYGLVDAYAAVLSSLDISGPSIPCDNSVYSISNLPNSYTVTWSWQNPYGLVLNPEASNESGDLRFPDDPPSLYPVLQQNTPSTNMCTLNKNGNNYIKNTIVATVKKNGTTVRTLTKPVDTGQNFSGNYAQAAHQYTNWYYPGVSGGYLGSGHTIYLYRGSTITLTSSDFVGATLSYSGTNPIGWTHSGNTVTFQFSFTDINDPNSPRYTQNPASLTITGTYPNSCECFQFTVIGQIPQNYALMSGDSPDMNLNISCLSDQTYSVSCGAIDNWELSVIDSATGETTHRSHVDGTEKTLNTSGWKSGIYIIKATVGKEVLTEKIQVK